jgi:hypothetical protein
MLRHPAPLLGGYSQDGLERAGAYRVYEHPADLLKHIGIGELRASQCKRCQDTGAGEQAS